MRITFISSSESENYSNRYWRCIVPIQAINRTGRHHADFLSLKDFNSNNRTATEQCEKSDILIIYKDLWGPTLSTIQHWKARGKTVIADFDEAYHLMREDQHEYQFWYKGKQNGEELVIDPPPIVQFKWGLQLVDGATVLSQRLADDWGNYTNIEVIPNYIDLNPYMGIYPKKRDEVIIGWKAEVDKIYSIYKSGALEAVEEVIKARDHVKFLVSGDVPTSFLGLKIPENRIIDISTLDDTSSWPEDLKYFDIGLAPLFGEFDQRDSWMPVLEYMVVKIPWVASQSTAYHEMKNLGWLVENNSLAWQRILLDMIDHLENYQTEAASDPYIFGLSKGIDENIDKTIESYMKIFNLSENSQNNATTARENNERM